MKNKKIYAKENFKINEYKIYVHDNYLEKQLYKSMINKYDKLSNSILKIIVSTNKLEVSKAINDIVNYYPTTTIDSEIKERVLFCLIQNKKLSNINLGRLLLNFEYQFELNTAYHEFDDDIVFSEKINNIPYINSIRSK